MNKGRCLGGAIVLALASFAGRVEARVVRYEINGKVYAYDTTDRQRVESARQRIEAANAADVAQAAANAELARSPLAVLFGSPAQREAAAAKTRLQQVMSQPESAPPAIWSAAPAPSFAAGAHSRPDLSMVRAKHAPHALKAAEERSSGAGPTSDAPGLRDGAQKSALKSVTFDFGSGIKTMLMTDGTISEESFDSSTLSKFGLLEPAAERLTLSVEQVRTRQAGTPETASD
jgi:hypothetical protein